MHMPAYASTVSIGCFEHAPTKLIPVHGRGMEQFSMCVCVCTCVCVCVWGGGGGGRGKLVGSNAHDITVINPALCV